MLNSMRTLGLLDSKSLWRSHSLDFLFKLLVSLFFIPIFHLIGQSRILTIAFSSNSTEKAFLSRRYPNNIDSLTSEIFHGDTRHIKHNTYLECSFEDAPTLFFPSSGCRLLALSVNAGY